MCAGCPKGLGTANTWDAAVLRPPKSSKSSTGHADSELPEAGPTLHPTTSWQGHHRAGNRKSQRPFWLLRSQIKGYVVEGPAQDLVCQVQRWLARISQLPWMLMRRPEGCRQRERPVEHAPQLKLAAAAEPARRPGTGERGGSPSPSA